MGAGGFELIEGVRAPRQASPPSCGAACLVMARMLVDPEFAEWITGHSGRAVTSPAGVGDASGATDTASGTAGASAGRLDADGASRRWAAAQAEVLRRTNALGRFPGMVQTPWPASLGTPPWGARAELERNCSVPGVAYEVHLVRFLADSRLAAAFDDTVARVGAGRPVVCYVGNDLMPRHVVLWARNDERSPVLQYDPADGSVARADRGAFGDRRMRSAGWNQPWLLLRPDPAVLASDPARRAAFVPAPMTTMPGVRPA